jgi:hypothetical protein
VASRVGDIIIDCTEPELLAGFWCEVLGYRVFARDETGVAIRVGRRSVRTSCSSGSASRSRRKIACTSTAPFHDD